MGLLDTLFLINDILGLPATIVDNMQESKNNKRIKNKTLQQQCDKLSVRLNDNISPESKAKEYFKISILKNLAWKDKTLHDNEKLFIYDYILKSENLPNDEKIIFMQDVVNKPKSNFFKTLFSKSEIKGNQVFGSFEEAKTFKETIIKLSECDGEVSETENKYIQDIISQLKLN